MPRFGDETLYTDTLPSSSGRASVKRYTLTEAGVVTSATVGFAAITEAGTNMRAVIYRVAGGVLTDLVAVGASTPVPAGGGWVTSVIADVPLAAGDYAIGAVCNGNNAYHAHNTFGFGDGYDSEMANGTVTFASPPSTWPGSDATYDYNVSAYATYTVGEEADERTANLSVTLGAVTLSSTATISQPSGGSGGSFGDGTAGGNTFPGSGNRAILSRFQVPVDCDLTNLKLRFAATTTAGANAKGLVYADGAGGTAPGARLGVGTAVVVPNGGGVVNSPISVTGLVAGTYVWLGSVLDNFQPYWSTDSGVGGLSRMEGTSYASPASTWTQSGTGGDRVNVEADYVTAGGAGIMANLSATLGPVTLTSSAVLGRFSNTSVILDAVLLAATAVLRIKAGVTATLGAVTISSTARKSRHANATITLGAVTISSSAKVGQRANANITLGAVGLSSTASVTGRVANTTVELEAVTLASTAQLSAGAAGANLSVTLDPVGLSATARLAVRAGGDNVLAPVALSATARLTVSAGGTTTLGSIGFSSTARLSVQAASENLLGPVILESLAALSQRADASIQLEPVLLTATARLQTGLAANASIMLGAVQLSSTASVTGEGIVSNQAVSYLVPARKRKYLVASVPRKYQIKAR